MKKQKKNLKKKTVVKGRRNQELKSYVHKIIFYCIAIDALILFADFTMESFYLGRDGWFLPTLTAMGVGDPFKIIFIISTTIVVVIATWFRLANRNYTFKALFK